MAKITGIIVEDMPTESYWEWYTVVIGGDPVELIKEYLEEVMELSPEEIEQIDIEVDGSMAMCEEQNVRAYEITIRDERKENDTKNN